MPFSFFTPKALCPKAQGCEALRATQGAEGFCFLPCKGFFKATMEPMFIMNKEPFQGTVYGL